MKSEGYPSESLPDVAHQWEDCCDKIDLPRYAGGTCAYGAGWQGSSTTFANSLRFVTNAKKPPEPSSKPQVSKARSQGLYWARVVVRLHVPP